MPLNYDHCAAVILAGGRSKRMGTCKALLPIGEEPLIRYIYGQLSAFDDRCLSANDPVLDHCLEIPVIRDVYENCGPLGGIHAALRHSGKDAVFVVPCDLPFFSREVPQLMLREFPEDSDVMVCIDSSGRVHPLCGIYRRCVLDKIEEYLRIGGRSVIPLLAQLKCRFFEIGRYLPETVLYNMNTPEDYQKIKE